nr:ATP-dependent metalloprotease [Entransia fimbriata]WKT05828.1 ATP-dependent metalloprotease [Entransia fimbriata]
MISAQFCHEQDFQMIETSNALRAFDNKNLFQGNLIHDCFNDYFYQLHDTEFLMQVPIRPLWLPNQFSFLLSRSILLHLCIKDSFVYSQKKKLTQKTLVILNLDKYKDLRSSKRISNLNVSGDCQLNIDFFSMVMPSKKYINIHTGNEYKKISNCMQTLTTKNLSIRSTFIREFLKIYYLINIQNKTPVEHSKFSIQHLFKIPLLRETQSLQQQFNENCIRSGSILKKVHLISMNPIYQDFKYTRFFVLNKKHLQGFQYAKKRFDNRIISNLLCKNYGYKIFKNNIFISYAKTFEDKVFDNVINVIDKKNKNNNEKYRTQNLKNKLLIVLNEREKIQHIKLSDYSKRLGTPYKKLLWDNLGSLSGKFNETEFSSFVSFLLEIINVPSSSEYRYKVNPSYFCPNLSQSLKDPFQYLHFFIFVILTGLLKIHTWISGPRAFWTILAILVDIRLSMIKSIYCVIPFRYGIHNFERFIDNIFSSQQILLSNIKTNVSVQLRTHENININSNKQKYNHFRITPIVRFWPFMFFDEINLKKKNLHSISLTFIFQATKSFQAILLIISSFIITPIMLNRFVHSISLVSIINKYFKQNASLNNSWYYQIIHKIIQQLKNLYLNTAIQKFFFFYFTGLVPWIKIWPYKITHVIGHERLIHEFEKTSFVFKFSSMVISPPNYKGLFRIMRNLVTRYLLIGPVGSGKHSLIYGMAADSYLPLLSLNCNKLLRGDSYYSLFRFNDKQRFYAFFEIAKLLSPCIVLVEGIERNIRKDVVLFSSSPIKNDFISSSDSSHSNDEFNDLSVSMLSYEELLFMLLKQISSLKWSGVFLVAITSTPSDMDPAFLRKKRFTRIFFLDLPKDFERQKIFQSFFIKKGLSKFSASFLNRIVYLTAGCTSAELLKLTNEFHSHSLYKDSKDQYMNLLDLEIVFTQVVKGLVKENSKKGLYLDFVFSNVGNFFIKWKIANDFFVSTILIDPNIYRTRFHYLQSFYRENNTSKFLLKEANLLSQISQSLGYIAAKDCWLRIKENGWEQKTRTCTVFQKRLITIVISLIQYLMNTFPVLGTVIINHKYSLFSYLKTLFFYKNALRVCKENIIPLSSSRLGNFLNYSFLRKSQIHYTLDFSVCYLFEEFDLNKESFLGIINPFVLYEDSIVTLNRIMQEEDALQWFEVNKQQQIIIHNFFSQQQGKEELQKNTTQNIKKKHFLEKTDIQLLENSLDSYQYLEPQWDEQHTFQTFFFKMNKHTSFSSNNLDAVAWQLQNHAKIFFQPRLNVLQSYLPLFISKIVPFNESEKYHRLDKIYQWVFGSIEEIYTNLESSFSKDQKDKRSHKNQMIYKQVTFIEPVFLENQQRFWEEILVKDLIMTDFFLRKTRLIDMRTCDLGSFVSITNHKQWSTIRYRNNLEKIVYSMIQDIYVWVADILIKESESLENIIFSLEMDKGF